MLIKAVVARLMSESRSRVRVAGLGFRDVGGGCRVGLGSAGGGEAVLNEAGRPGRASRQLGESERARIG